MWQGIQNVFKKKAKSPDPNKQRMNRTLTGEQQTSGFTLNVQRTDTQNETNSAQQDDSPFAEAMRLAKIEQQKQGTSEFNPQDKLEAQSPEGQSQSRGNRLSIGSPIKGLLSLSAKLVRGLSEDVEESKNGRSSFGFGAAQQSPHEFGMLNQLTQDQKNVAYLLGGTSKVESLVLGLHGFRINDNPQDREVFISCPQCGIDVFDSGLANDIQCKKCQCIFTPGQKSSLSSPEQIPQSKVESRAMAAHETSPLLSVEPQNSARTNSDSGGGLPREISAFELDEEEEELVKKKLEMPFEKAMPQQEEEKLENRLNSLTYPGDELNLLKPKNPDELMDYEPEKIQEGEGEQSNLNQTANYKVEENFYEAAQNQAQLQGQLQEQSPEYGGQESLSSETDSEEESKVPDYRKKMRKRGANSTKKGVPFTADNLIERPGQVLSSLFSSLKLGQSQPHGNQPIQSHIDSSSAYVNEIESVQLFVIEETVMSDFKEVQTQDINYKLILDALLMPFFQLRTRILEKHAFFTIGDIQFFVATTAPHDFGKVSTNTRVKLSSAVRKSESIQRINLVPLRRINMPKQELLQSVLKPYFSNNIGNCLFKAQVFEIHEQEFFVKYSRPFFGVISNGTEVKMDSSMPKSVRVVRVAPIWLTKEAFAFASRQTEETIKLIKKEILTPYFFGGSMCYIEKGETIKIAEHEFFINECQPRTGIVDETTTIEVEIGFTQETFQKKQVLADQRYAERLQQQMANSSGAGPGYSMNSGNRMSAYSEHHPAEVDFQNFVRDLQASEQNDSSQMTSIRISLGSGHRGSNSGSSRRRRRHSMNANSDVVETRFHLEHSPNLLRAYGAPAEEFQRVHSSSFYRTQSGAASQQFPPSDLYEILTHMRNDGVNIEDLQAVEQLGCSSHNSTPKSIVDSLPVRIITEEQVAASQAQAQKEEAMSKCMICLIDYEAGDELRTMPCMHFFHRECIDRWLLKQGSTCPICKFNVRQDYNVTSTSQMTSNRRHSERHSYGNRSGDIEFYQEY